MAPKECRPGRRKQLLRRLHLSLALPTFRPGKTNRHADPGHRDLRLVGDPAKSKTDPGYPGDRSPGRKRSADGKNASGTGYQSPQRSKEHRTRPGSTTRKSRSRPDAGIGLVRSKDHSISSPGIISRPFSDRAR